MIQNAKAPFALATVALIGLSLWWFGSGYGKVSHKTYEFATAIYGACSSRNEARLEKTAELLYGELGSDLPAREKQWLRAMIETAQQGNWEDARDRAREMMKAQAEPVS